MNPIQVNCPGCQKLFLVRPEDLTPGQARFQCTACQTFFGFQWPQPPGTENVRAVKLDPKELQSPAAPSKTQPSPNVTYGKATKVCFNCGETVDAVATECSHCGVIFDKVKKIKPPDPVMEPAGPEIIAAWEAVKANYADEKRHESFIQLCLSRENLAFASSQYRAILNVNPADDVAQRMQGRIVNLATTAYIAAQAAARPQQPGGKSRATGFALGVSILLIAIGIFSHGLRPLIALGGALIAFIFVLRAMNR